MEHGKHNPVSIHKAKEIMKHGEVHGHELSKKQKGLFGFIAGGGKATKLGKKKRMSSDGIMMA